MFTYTKINEFQESLKNNIWIIGSGSLDCYPKPGCHDKLCELARKGGKDRRLCASSIFYKNCVFDLGSGVWNRLQLRKIKPQAIIISHVHYDHISDLMELPNLSYEIPVFASILVEDLFKIFKIKAKYFEPNESFNPTPELKIETEIAVHTFTRPVSLLKFDEIVYAPDLGEFQKLQFAEEARIWLGDGFSFDEDFIIQEEKLHQSMKKLLLQLKKVKSLEMVLFLGIGHHSFFPHEDLELIVKKFGMDNNLPFGVEIGFDNQILSL